MPPKRGLCPKESNTLGATEVQFEAWDSQDTGYHPRIHEQELFFVDFVMKTLFLWFHPGIRENPRLFRDENLFFF